MGVLQICDHLLVVEKCFVQVQWENLYVTVNYYLIFRLYPTGKAYLISCTQTESYVAELTHSDRSGA